VEMAPFIRRRRPGHYGTRHSQDEFGNLIVEASQDGGRNWQIVHTEETDGNAQWYPFDPSPANMESFNQSIRRNLAERARLRALPGRSMSQRRDDEDRLREIERSNQQLEDQRRAFQQLGGIRAYSGEVVLSRSASGDIIDAFYGTAYYPSASVMMPVWASAAVRAAWGTEQLRPPPPPEAEVEKPEPSPVPQGVDPRAWGVITALGKDLKEKEKVE